MTEQKIREKIFEKGGKGTLIGFENCVMPVEFCKLSDGYYIYKANTKHFLEDMICHAQSIDGLIQFMQGSLWFRLNGNKENKSQPKKVTRNEYYNYIRENGRIPSDDEMEIIPLDLSKYHLSEDTVRIANANFTEETTNRNGEYMLSGHWMSDLCYQFAKKSKFDLVQIDGYSSYAYSDEQMAVFTYCEGDITLTPYENKKDYEKEKARAIKFYKEEY